MNFRQALRRFNRKHRQIVNLTVTALFLAVTCCIIMQYQSHLSNMQRAEAEKANAALHDAILARQDSLIAEIEHLKIGISDATNRTYKVPQTNERNDQIQKRAELHLVTGL